MPVIGKTPDHLCAEWASVTEEGQQVTRVLDPEDVLPFMSRGYNVTELVEHFDAPREAVEHVIMGIPELMVYREGMPLEHTLVRRLPRLEEIQEDGSTQATPETDKESVEEEEQDDKE